MGKLRQQHPLYQRITERNLLRQFDLLQDLFEVGRSVDFRINAHIVSALHSAAATHLVERPGHC